jgi:hypothetical protein
LKKEAGAWCPSANLRSGKLPLLHQMGGGGAKLLTGFFQNVWHKDNKTIPKPDQADTHLRDFPCLEDAARKVKAPTQNSSTIHVAQTQR